jgi:heme-degrading monooxygenase HmoA
MGEDMIAVIFEVWPADGKRQNYLDIAARIRPLLEEIDGFISVERFESLSEPGKILSLSFFRDEEAVRTWRNLAAHRKAQTAARSGIFSNYRIRISSVIRDYGMTQREEAPGDSREANG